MGMADGGLVDLLVPSDTFPDANYAGGGIVAFNAAGPVVAAPAAPVDPNMFYGMSTDIQANMDRLNPFLSQPTPRRQQLEQYYEGQMSPEAQEKGRKEDLYTMLAQIGFGMAGTNSPSFLQAVGQSANAAIPGAVQARKERKAAVRQGMAALADIEGMTSAERRAIVEASINQATAAGQGLETRAEADRGRRHDIQRDSAKMAHDKEMERLQARGGGGGGGGGGGFGNSDLGREVEAEFIHLATVPLSDPTRPRKSLNELRVLAYNRVRARRERARENAGGGPGVRDALAGFGVTSAGDALTADAVRRNTSVAPEDENYPGFTVYQN
jgi:hypothetical protein